MVEQVKRKMLPSQEIKNIINRAGRIYYEPLKSMAIPANTTVTISFTNQDNVPFLMKKIVGYAQISSSGLEVKTYKVKFQDSGRSQLMMTDAMHGSALGSREYPTEFETPYLLRGSGQFQVEITNVNTVAIDVFLTFIGYKISDINDNNGINSIDALKSVLMQAGSLYFQSVSALALLAGGIQRIPFTNQDNIPFVISRIVGYAENSAGLAQSLNYALSFKDSGRQALWMNSPIYGTAVGSGNLPMVLDTPYPLGGNSTFETEISNVDALITENIYVTLIGYRLNGIQI